jgi:integrase
VLKADIGAGISNFAPPHGYSPKAASDKDFEALSAEFNTDSKSGPRNLSMVYLLGLCGLRVGELVGLNARDLLLDQGKVRVADGKTGFRMVDLPLCESGGVKMLEPATTEALTLWLEQRREGFPDLTDDDALFVTLQAGPERIRLARGIAEQVDTKPGKRLTENGVRHVLRRAAGRAGISPNAVRPHALRHLFGVRSILAGLPEAAVRGALGHRTTFMTARYTVLSDEQKSLAYAKARIAKGLRLPGARTEVPTGKALKEELRQRGTSISEAASKLWGK